MDVDEEKPLLGELAKCRTVRFGVIFAVCFSLLAFLSNWSFIINASLLLLTWFVAEAISNGISNSLPRKLIEDRESKAVFITGCDTGFGNALARRLDSLGFTVYAGCLQPTEKEALELSQTTSINCNILFVDVTQQSTLDDAKKRIQNTLGSKKLWAVVNNAGIGGAFTEIEWCPVEIYQKILDVNTIGPIRVTKTFLPLLRKAEGRIVMVASLAGRYTFPGSSAYSMSKSAVVSFADGLRREMVKWGISIHTVEPTVYRTPLSAEKTMKKSLQKIWDQLPQDIKESYGAAYYADFLTKLSQFSNSARPTEKITEVIDDMVDAVAGDAPQSRYVPNAFTKLRARFICSLPMGVQDALLCKLAAPSTPPAAAPRLRESPLRKSLKGLGPKALKRHMSSPLMTIGRRNDQNGGTGTASNSESDSPSEVTDGRMKPSPLWENPVKEEPQHFKF